MNFDDKSELWVRIDRLSKRFRVDKRAVTRATNFMIIAGMSLAVITTYRPDPAGGVIGETQIVEKERHGKKHVIYTATFVALTTTGANTWTVPSDWNSAANTIEVIGGGGSGGSSQQATLVSASGGAGGAYSAISNLSLTVGASVNYTIGVGGAAVSKFQTFGNGNAGGDTFFNGTTLASSSVGAKGGGAGIGSTSSASASSGGAAASGVGTTKFSGGNGALCATALTATPAATGGGGAGGAAGDGISSASTTNTASAGGAGNNGASGGGAGGASGGSTGSNGINFGNATSGSGGGGGARVGTTNANAGDGGFYGAGGGGTACTSNGGTGTSGAGAQGIIFITYTPIAGKKFRSYILG